MMKSGLLRKLFETWYASDIVLSNPNDLLLLDSHEAERRKKSQIVISNEKQDSLDSITHKNSIQRGMVLAKGSGMPITSMTVQH